MADLIVKKATKEYLKTMNKRCPDATIEALDEMVKKLLDSANMRAEENNRKTVMSYDL